MPSKTGPTAGKEDRTTSLRLNTTPTQSASLPARSSSSRQRSVAPFNLHCSRSHENFSNKVFSLPNRPCAAQCSCGSIPADADDVRDSGDLKDNAKVMGMDEQVSRETEVAGEGEEVNGVPCARLPPIQLTSSQGDATKGLITKPTGTSSLSSTSWPTSSATCIPCPVPNLHEGPTTLPPCSIPLPKVFANANSQPSTQLSSKGQRTHGFISSIPFHPPPNSQKRRLKAQPRCLRLSPVCSPTTPPFPRQSLDYYSTYPPLDTFEHDERRTSKGSLLSITVDGVSNPSSSMHQHDAHSILPPVSPQDLYQYPASHRLHPSSSFPPTRRCVSVSPFHRPENLRGRRLSRSLPGSPMVSGGHHSLSSTHQLASSISNNRPSIPCQWQHDSQDEWTSMMLSNTAHSSNTREPGNSKDKAEVGGPNGQDTKIEVAAEREEVTKDNEGLVAKPVRALSSSTTSQSTSTASWPTSTTGASAKTLPMSTVSRSTSTAPCIPNSSPTLHRGSAISSLCSFTNTSS